MLFIILLRSSLQARDEEMQISTAVYCMLQSYKKVTSPFLLKKTTPECVSEKSFTSCFQRPVFPVNHLHLEQFAGRDLPARQ